MMLSVWLIVEEATGVAAQGGRGEDHLSLVTDGVFPELGSPISGFASYDAAEAHRNTFDCPFFYKVIELPIQQEAK